MKQDEEKEVSFIQESVKTPGMMSFTSTFGSHSKTTLDNNMIVDERAI